MYEFDARSRRAMSGMGLSLLDSASDFASSVGQQVTQFAQSTANYTPADVGRLQQAVIDAGCSVGSAGVDRSWGPSTRAGVVCWAGRISGGMAAILLQFPFIGTLDPTLLSASGQPTAPPTTGGGAVRQPTPATPPETTPTTEEIPIYEQWYFWAGLAVLAAAGIGGIAYYQHKQNLEDEDMSPELAFAR